MLIAEQLPGGFIIYQENENRDILFVNHIVLELYECDTLDEFKALTGYSFEGMVHPDDIKKVQNSIDNQIKGVHGNMDYVEYRILTKNGNVKWIDDYGHFSSSTDFGELYYVFLFDVTERKRAQTAEKKFFFDMSHEIMTPMNAVSTNLLLAKSHRNDPELFDKYFENLVQATSNLTLQFEKILNIQKEFILKEDRSAAEKAPENNDPPRVLIAEDNLVNQELLKTILEDAGFLAEVAGNGSQAVNMVESHEPGYYTIVFMDIRMPEMDGHAAARQIRKMPQMGMDELPIYALSANSRPEDIRKSYKSGMNGHLSKPYDMEQIIGLVMKYIK